MGDQPRRGVHASLEAQAKGGFTEFKTNSPPFVVTKGSIVGISAAHCTAKGAKTDCSKGVL
jgi:hypothetical protein